MIHNDVLRRLRYALTLNDRKVIEIFMLVNHKMSSYHLHKILKKEGEEEFVLCTDQEMSAFLDGLIIQRRGRQQGPGPVPLSGNEKLTNNAILRKLKIALELRSEEVETLLMSAGLKLSKSELSAFTRRPGHRSYKVCGDQVIRNLLVGLTLRFRPVAKESLPSKKQWP